MNWFAKFEKKFSKYAIKNLMFYIIVLYAIGFVMNTFFNGLYDAYFSLDFAMIFKGQYGDSSHLYYNRLLTA
ncbi:MAG: hypothetical protein ACLS9K_10205 [Lachnospira eligens]